MGFYLSKPKLSKIGVESGLKSIESDRDLNIAVNSNSIDIETTSNGQLYKNNFKLPFKIGNAILTKYGNKPGSIVFKGTNVKMYTDDKYLIITGITDKGPADTKIEIGQSSFGGLNIRDVNTYIENKKNKKYIIPIIIIAIVILLILLNKKFKYI